MFSVSVSGEAKEVSLAAKPGMAPLLVIAATCDDPQPHETSVVAENQVIFKDVGFLDGIESMMMLYYAIWSIQRSV